MREREQLKRLGMICGSIDAPRLVSRQVLFDGRKRFAYYRGRVPVAPHPPLADPTQCLFWRNAAALP
jgi:hypothetical protein